MKKICGDVTYTSKPLFTGFVLGLIKKIYTKKPLILDMDDWELGLIKEILSGTWSPGRLSYLARSAIQLYSVGLYWNPFIMEKLIPLADDVTVSNSFL